MTELMRAIPKAGKTAISTVVLVVAFATMAGISWFRWPDVLIDFGEELYIPWQLHEGRRLYEDLYYLRGPLSPYLNLLVLAAFGMSYRALAFFNIALVAGVAFLIYRLFLRDGQYLSATIATLVFLLIFAFPQYISVGNYNFVAPYSHEQTHGIAIFFLGLYSLRRFFGSKSPFWLLAAGLSSGLSFLTKPELFASHLVAIASALFLYSVVCRAPWPTVLNRTLVFLSGFLLPVIACVALLPAPEESSLTRLPVMQSWIQLIKFGGAVVSDPLTTKIMGLDEPGARMRSIGVSLIAYVAVGGAFLTLNHVLGSIPMSQTKRAQERDSSDRPVPIKRNGPDTTAVSESVAVLITLYGMFLFMLRSWFDDPRWWLEVLRPLPVILLFYLLGQLWFLPRQRSEERWSADGLTFLALTVFSLCLLGRMPLNTHVYHYGFSLALPGTLVLCNLIVSAGANLARRLSGTARAFLALSLALITVAVLDHVEISRQYYVLKTAWIGDAFRSYGTGIDSRTAVLNALLQWMDKHVERSATVTVFPEGAMINFLSRRPSPSPYCMYNPVIFRMKGEAEILRALQASPPDYVLLVDRSNTEHGARYFGKDYAQSVLAWIVREYVEVRTFGAPPLEGKGFGVRVLKRQERPADQPGA